LYKDAIDTAAASKKRELAEGLLEFFVKLPSKECFSACLYTCYDVIRPDVALELAWRHKFVDLAFPFMIQTLREFSDKVDMLVQDKEKREKERLKKSEQPNSFESEPGFINQTPQIAYYPTNPGGFPDPNQFGYQDPNQYRGF
jgi:clathrin heavy chain